MAWVISMRFEDEARNDLFIGLIYILPFKLKCFEQIHRVTTKSITTATTSIIRLIASAGAATAELVSISTWHYTVNYYY